MANYTGDTGEGVAARVLEDAGMRVIQRNYACRGGEIDLICMDGDVIVFVEVKTRLYPGNGEPLEAITRQKRRNISRAALTYLKAHNLTDRSARFDAVAVSYEGVKHIKGAFDYEA